MAIVAVAPLPTDWRPLSRFTPGHPPIFPEGWPPSRADAELAVGLLVALDEESQRWYSGSLARLRAFLASGG